MSEQTEHLNEEELAPEAEQQPGETTGGEEGQPQPQQEAGEPGEKKRKKSRKKPSEAEKLGAERDEYKDALIRERADFENFKKRNAVAASRAYADGQSDALLAMLPVLDNLERATQVDAASTSADNLMQGVQLVKKQFCEVFAKLGVEEIQAEGKPFDPSLHNAVMQEPAEEGQEGGMVKEVLMKGYRTKDKVLRHSMVKVTE